MNLHAHRSLPFPRPLRPCVGVLCDVVERCARYHAIDGTRVVSSRWIGTCAPAGGPPHPLFVPFNPPPSVHHRKEPSP